MGALLLMVEQVRKVGGLPDIEFGLEISISTTTRAGPVNLKVGGETAFDDFFALEPGLVDLPRFSIGPITERKLLINEVMQEILHSVGCAWTIDWNAEITSRDQP